MDRWTIGILKLTSAFGLGETWAKNWWQHMTFSVSVFRNLKCAWNSIIWRHLCNVQGTIKINSSLLSYKIDKMSCLVTKPTKWLCAQRRLRSAWASAQSDQSLRCSHEESLIWSLATHWADSEDSDQTGRMPRLISVFAGMLHNHIVGFVMRRLKCFM